MKSILVAMLCLVLSLSACMLCLCYSHRTLSTLVNTFDCCIFPSIESEDWSYAYTEFSQLNIQWNRYKIVYMLYVDSESIYDIDSSFAKAQMYIKAKDLSNGSGELLSLRRQLNNLQNKEDITLQNIF